VEDIVIEPEYLDISIPTHTRFNHPVKPGHTVFAYIVEGEGFFGARAGAETLVLYDDSGDEVEVTTEGSPVRFLLISGKPIGEPVAWAGPIVMNTKEELRIAFEEYRKGTFIKHD
jgi:quercetin 2,3-dioxygenase